MEAWNAGLTKKKSNVLVDMGCNPGNVSVWVRVALEMLASEKQCRSRKPNLIAQELGLQTVQISEIDTQKSCKPKRTNEYCNTWSSTMDPFYEEALAPTEFTWGTHESADPSGFRRIDFPDDRYVLYDNIGCCSYAQTYSPMYRAFTGMLIRHSECYTIGNSLKVVDEEGIVEYCPSVYYIYHPCDLAMLSVLELKQKNLQFQQSFRLMTSEITEGRDELGVAMFFENGDMYWIGSLLDIEEARELFDHEMDEYLNATSVQVLGGYISGIVYLIDKISKGEYSGLIYPDDLDPHVVFPIMRPLLGEFVMQKVDDFVPTRASKYFSQKNESVKPVGNAFTSFAVPS